MLNFSSEGKDKVNIKSHRGKELSMYNCNNPDFSLFLLSKKLWLYWFKILSF